MFKSVNLSHLSRLTLLIVALLAVGLRFGWSGTRPFAFDEAYVSRAALQMDHGGGLATIGMPSSAGVPNLPGAIWIFALPFALSADPLIASAFIGLLSLVAIGMTAHIVDRSWRRFAGNLPILAAALYLAANPYSVLYARSIWAQNLLPLFGALWLFAALHAWTSESRRQAWIALTVIIAGVTVLVHFAGITLVLATIYLAIRARWWRRFAIGGLLIGIGVLLIAGLPSIIRFVQQSAILHQFSSTLTNATVIDLSAPLQLIDVAVGRSWGFLLLGNQDMATTNWLPGILILGIVAAGILLGSEKPGTQGAISSAPAPNDPAPNIERYDLYAGHAVELSVALLIASFIWLIAHKTSPFSHYQLIALPAVAVLIGAGIAKLTQIKISHAMRRLSTLAAFSIVIVCAVVWTIQIGQRLDQAGSIEPPGGLGTPLGILQTIATAAPIARPVLLFTHGDDPGIDGEPAVFAALWWNRGDSARIVNGESTLVLPDTPATLIATQAAFQAWEELRDAGLTVNAQPLPRRSGAQPFMMVAYDGRSAPQGFTMIPAVPFADGLTLIGWRVRMVGLRLRVSTLWHVQSMPTVSSVQQFTHLRTINTLTDQPFKGSDVPISIRSLRAGDTAIIMADFYPADFPASVLGTSTQFWIDVGQYTLSDLKRIPLTDASADHIRLGPFFIPEH